MHFYRIKDEEEFGPKLDSAGLTYAADDEFTTGRDMLEPPGSPQIREPRRVPAHYRRFDYLKSIKEICVRSITAVIQYSS
jgi:hypothetical protein